MYLLKILSDPAPHHAHTNTVSEAVSPFARNPSYLSSFSPIITSDHNIDDKLSVTTMHLLCSSDHIAPLAVQGNILPKNGLFPYIQFYCFMGEQTLYSNSMNFNFYSQFHQRAHFGLSYQQLENWQLLLTFEMS